MDSIDRQTAKIGKQHRQANSTEAQTDKWHRQTNSTARQTVQTDRQTAQTDKWHGQTNSTARQIAQTDKQHGQAICTHRIPTLDRWLQALLTCAQVIHKYQLAPTGKIWKPLQENTECGYDYNSRYTF